MDFSKLIETLMYFIPAGIVLGAVYIVIKRFLDNDYRLRVIEVKKMLQKDLMPMRFQAYERLTLFLERISPSSLLIRVNRAGMSARELQSELLITVRAEFEHNITQQIYVSHDAWELVKGAKEDTVKIINIASAAVGDNGTSADLNKQIFEIIMKTEIVPTAKALEFINHEVKQFM